MIKNLLFIFTLFIVTNSYAQDQRWSVEANYSLIPASGFFGSDNILEVGMKYRMLDFKFMKVGLSVNGGYFVGDESVSFADDKSNSFVIQPRVFSEFNLPFSNKLKPSLGLGYSVVSVSSPSDITPWGFNFNLGLSYDISNKWFVQAQYDFINLSEGRRVLENQRFIEKINNIRVGIGFRF